MAKQQKKSTPEVYVGLIQDSRNVNRCIMEDLDFNFTICDSFTQIESMKSFEELIKPTIAKVWKNFNEFDDTVNEQTALAYHEQLFGKNPPDKQELITTKLMIWHKIAATAKNNLTNQSGTPKDPETGRKSTILTSVYTRGDVTEGSADIKTYQALKCLELFRDCIGDHEQVTEGELKQYVIDHADILKTRQDPWRIFQYYRPTLIKAKLIRRK